MSPRVCGILLAGGAGTRLRSLYPDVPKPFIEVAGRPFIHWVLRQFAAQGIEDFVVSLGHLADVAERLLDERPVDGLHVRTVREQKPLGTGGAARLAAASCDHDYLAIANADSLVLADWHGIWSRLQDPAVAGVVLAVEVDDASRFGQLDVDAQDRLLGFHEKQPGAGLINAGVYVLKRHVIARFPKSSPLSLEQDVFPALLAAGIHIEVERTRAEFLDIGTPDTVRVAARFVKRHFAVEVIRDH
ncbi:MAG: NTP transferase domain-containing protein [Pirellulales bacterium]|nr:NTP transferase domain-containing protein [Pirellulales bacterium]